MSSLKHLHLQVAAARLLAAQDTDDDHDGGADEHGHGQFLTRAAFARVLHEAAPFTVERVAPEHALAYLAADANEGDDTVVAQRARAVHAFLRTGDRATLASPATTPVPTPAEQKQDQDHAGIAHVCGRLRRWLAGAHGMNELRKARSPAAARRVLAALCAAPRPNTTAAELEAALVAAGAVDVPDDEVEEKAEDASADEAEDDDDDSEGSAVSAFWNDDDDSDDEDEDEAAEAAWASRGANAFYRQVSAEQEAAKAAPKAKPAPRVQLNPARLRALAGGKAARAASRSAARSAARAPSSA